MAKVSTAYYWAGCDISGIVRNWTANNDNTANVQMTLSGRVVTQLAEKINHLASRTPRTIFTWHHHYASTDGTWATYYDRNPLLQYSYYDNVVNNNRRRYKVFALPRALSNADNHAYLYSNIDDTVNTAYVDVNRTGAFPSEIYYVTADHNRGNATNSHIHEALSVTSGLKIHDIVVQEDEQPYLDNAAYQQSVDMMSTRPGSEVTSNIFEDMRKLTHNLRTTYHPIILSYAAMTGTGGDYVMPESSGPFGALIQSNTYVNLIAPNLGISARNADTPGVSCPAYACGVGRSNNVPCQFEVLAAASNCNAVLKFIGPAHVSDNNCEANITSNVVSWYLLSDPLYLNSNALDTDITENRNKIDVHGMIIGENACGNLAVYAMRGWSYYS